MKLSHDVAVEARRLYHVEHWRVGTIATQLKLHHTTVRRALGLLQPRPRKEGGEGPPALVMPFVPFIAQTLERYPKLTATRLWDMLRERGYAGSVRQLRRYVFTVRPRPKPDPVLELETLKGEQAQVDWAHVGRIAVPGGTRSLWLFVMVLRFSRAMWGEFVMDLSAHQVARSLLRASVALGGCPRTWLFDNAKTVVLARHDTVIRYHPALLELCSALHVEPRACAVRAPRQKGGVERAIRYLRDRFLAARVIAGVAQGNAALSKFIAETAHPRPHPTMAGRTVQEVFDEERATLLSLPPTLPATDRIDPINIDRRGFFHFDTNRYSVPTAHVGKTLTLVGDDKRLRVLDGSDCVAEHERCYGRHQRLEKPEHRTELVKQRRAARATKGRDRLTAAVPRTVELFAAWLAAGRNVGLCTIRTLKLLDLYGADTLRTAVDDILGKGIDDISALAVRCDHHRAAQSQPPPVDLQLPEHISDRDVIPHDLESYDGNDDDN